MGGAIKRSLISAYFLLHVSAYFLTAQSYKRMRLTTRVYGTCFSIISLTNSPSAHFSLLFARIILLVGTAVHVEGDRV